MEGRDYEREFEEAAERVQRGAPSAANDHDHLAEWGVGLDGLEAPLNEFVSPFAWGDGPTAIPRRQWIYGRHYIRKFVSATFSPGGVGKSSLVITEAMAMASNRKLLGCYPGQRYRVAYWNGEDPLEETQRRVFGAALHYGLTPQDLEGFLFLGSGREAELIIAEQRSSGTTILSPNVEMIVDTIRRLELDVIIVDPFVSSHRVTENDNNAIDMVAKTWGRIADQTNTAVELVHHTRKANGAETTVEDGRGASALLYAARSARALNAMTKEEGERAGVERHRGFFRADNGKANLAPPPEGSDWFQMVSVDLDNGDGIHESDHVGVVTSWKWPDPFDGVTAADLRAVQERIASADWRESPQASSWVGKAIAEALDLDADDKADRQKIRSLLATWLKAGVLVRVTVPDEHRKDRPMIRVGRLVEEEA